MLILLIGTAVAGGMLWTQQRGRTVDSPTVAAPEFTSYDLEATPDLTAAELTAILADNPYVSIDLKPPDVDCVLPDIQGPIPADALPDYVRTASECMAAMWQGPMADRGFAWSKPRFAVYDPASPPRSDCAEDMKDTDITYCYTDNTVLWPTTAERFLELADPTPEQNKQMMLWDIAWAYVSSTYSHSGAFVYVLALSNQAEDGSAQSHEVDRRLLAQRNCLRASTAYALPEGLRPAGEVAAAIPDEMSEDSADPSIPTRATRLAWVRIGAASPGDLGVCDTWTVPADRVA